MMPVFLAGSGTVMSARRTSIRSLDLALIGVLLALCPVAWLVPERRWSAVADLAVRARWPSQRSRKQLASIQASFAELDPASVRQIEREVGATWILRQLQLLRSYRPGGWRPRISIEGRERIERALAQGRGVILWNTAFRFSDLVVKIGMHDAGYGVTHLSMPEHGWSSSRFGIRWLNPIWVRIERRYLAERVVIDPANPNHATQQIKQTLNSNGIVSITAIRGAARKPAAIRVLGARFRLGLGAPILAYETGAALLPVFTLRLPDGSFRILIEAAIPVPSDRPRIEAAMASLELLGERVDRHVRAMPGQWNWWYMEPAEDVEEQGMVRE